MAHCHRSSKLPTHSAMPEEFSQGWCHRCVLNPETYSWGPKHETPSSWLQKAACLETTDPGPTKSGPNLAQLRNQMEISRKIMTPFDYWLFHYCGICTVSNAFTWNSPKKQQQFEISYFPKTREWNMYLYHTTSPQPGFLSGCLTQCRPLFPVQTLCSVTEIHMDTQRKRDRGSVSSLRPSTEVFPVVLLIYTTRNVFPSILMQAKEKKGRTKAKKEKDLSRD